MANKPGSACVPDWVDPANDRKTPYTDTKLDRLAADFIADGGTLNGLGWGISDHVNDIWYDRVD